MSCGSELVRFFVRFGVQQACMKSPLGRNARFCAICFGLSASDIGRYKLNRICFADKVASYLPAGFMEQEKKTITVFCKKQLQSSEHLCSCIIV